MSTAEQIAEDLYAYGEVETSTWMLTCTADEHIRVCSVGAWICSHGPTAPSGASMLFAKALALAAVYVREGAPRDLARSRRLRARDVSFAGERWPPFASVGYEHGVGDDLKEFLRTAT